jgi:hypothetical protein
MGFEITQVQYPVSNTPQQATVGPFAYPKLNKLTMQCIVDFYLQSMFEGLAYQIRAGTITTPLVGDVVITDTAAEIALDAPAGLAAIPVFANISVRLGTGTLHEYAIKSVPGVSTAGTAFIPLPLYLDGVTAKTGSRCSARVAAAGGVTVTAELATTTRRHWSVSNPVAVGAGHEFTSHNWEPRLPPVIQNNACCYVQVAATGTGPSYYANLDFIELRPENIY